jgi:hypothetical protein
MATAVRPAFAAPDFLAVDLGQAQRDTGVVLLGADFFEIEGDLTALSWLEGFWADFVRSSSRMLSPKSTMRRALIPEEGGGNVSGES